jgi:hypothetical protein
VGDVLQNCHREENNNQKYHLQLEPKENKDKDTDGMRYQQVPTEVPGEPPLYDDVEAQRSSEDSLAREFEQMEMEEEPDSGSLGQRLRISLNSKVQSVRTKVLDPLAEGYAHLQRFWEVQLARLGNPLIVKRFVYVIVVAFIVYLIAATGLMPEDSSRQSGSFSDRDLLLNFAKDAIDLRSMEEHLEYFSSMEHTSGTAGDLSLARYVQKYFKEKGLRNSEFMESESLLNFPEKITLTTSDEEWDLTQQFNPFSKEGEVKGGLLYVNYGRSTDYEKLEDGNIDVKEAICLMKYGGIPESEKMLIAEHSGCIGVLFTSETDSFPDSAERRAVAIPEFYTGDPLTPGWSSGVASERMDQSEVPLPKLPSASLTWNQAKQLWGKLDQGYKFDDFQSGDKSLQITLNNKVVYKENHAIWNVLGKIDGKEQSDKAMIIGAARDAPCKGAVNPGTGTAVMLEVIEVLNKLRVKFNWEPLRTIYFISWDSSEYNFGGVTELIERDIQEMRREATVYLDLSDAVAGDQLEITTTALLKTLLNEYQEEYKFSYKQFDSFKNSLPFMAQGIPVIDIGYRGTPYPEYTCDDTFEMFKKLDMDPAFERHRTLVSFIVTIVLHVIEDPLIPFDIVAYSDEININIAALQEYASKKQPDKKYNFEPLSSAIFSLRQLGRDMSNWEHAWREIVDEGAGLEPSMLTVHRWNWNNKLNLLEKYFLDGSGLPGRPWYKNTLFGPQFFKPEDDPYWFSFPGIRDAIFYGMEVQEQIDSVSKLIMDGCKSFVQG